MKWISLFVVACSAPAHVAQPAHDHACVPLAAPSERALYGRVTDASGQPLAGVTVQELDWSPLRAAMKTQTRADGAYELSTVHGTDVLVTFELERRRIVWAHVDAPRRVDVELDRTQPTGVLAVHDGLIESGDPCGAWICPPDRAPVDLWWTHARPCPEGAQLHYVLGSAIAGVGVQCELDGKPHGASTSWVLTPEHRSLEHVGWYDHGQRCGQWRDTPELVPPAIDHP